MNLEKIVTAANELIRETGNFLRNEITKVRAADIEKKQVHDFVTYVDKTSEKQLVEGLARILPEAGFLTEEKTTAQTDKPLRWIIDPLDGTTNYIHGLPPYSISVALAKDNKLIAGIIYEVTHNELFYGWKNGGAFLNGNPIHVSSTKKVFDSFLATGFPFKDYKYLDNYMKTLSYFMENSQGLRRLGSAAVDLAYVACGRFDGFYEYSLQPWDIATGAFLVEEAGGKVTDFTGSNNFLFGEEIIAANPLIFEELQATIHKILLG
ncbi:MAG: inositol monophosphatase [Bacteroidales bacterium]|nr:inositol monophosphatase [Bacteroidales bacterium]